MKVKVFIVMFYLGLSLWTNLTAAVLKGRVMDMNRLPLQQVKIFISPEETRVWFTDAGGNFSFPLPAGSESITLVFRKNGYHEERWLLNLDEPLEELEIVLTPLARIRETAVVTASRIAVNLLRSPWMISVIGEDTLELMPRAIAADEALKSLPGIKIDNQANGQRVHLSIRGQGILTERGIRGIQVLLDGLPLNDPTGFAPDLFDVDWAAVEKIEVFRGPSASLYGGGSAGGVISIDTRSGANLPLAGEFHTYAGSNGFWKTLGQVGSKGKNYDLFISASRTQGDGYRVHTKFRANNAYGKLNWQPSSRFQVKAIFLATGFFNENAEGLNLEWLAQDRRMANPDAVTFNEYQETRRITGGIIGKLAINQDQDLRFNLYLRSTLYDESVPSSIQHRVFTTPGSSLQYEIRLGKGRVRNRLSTGIDFDWQRIGEHRHPNLGLAVEGPELGSHQLIKQNRLGLYLLDNIQLGSHWTVFLSLRRDHIENRLEDYLKANGLDLSGDRNFKKTTGKVGLTWNPVPGFGIFTSWGTGFLPPATEELYANPDALGGFNTSLVPATSRGVEFGIRGSMAQRFIYDATVFRLNTDNDFERYRIPGRPLETFYRNAGHSKRWGFETLVQWFPTDFFSISTAYTYSDFTYTDYTSMTFPGNLVGKRLPNSPIHQASVNIAYRLGRNWKINLSEDFQSRSYVDATNQTWIDGFGLLGCRLAYTWQSRKARGEIFIAGKNLTNEKYIAFTEPDPDGNSYQPGPEREFFVGVQISL
jgi:iron complex outermembrane receptor protein